ncbi:MAG: Eco57I restriction-modification methylase domain-containing protein [Methanobrevibacter sp.]|jgi:hypothetical protein|nr:Eco57I restriction-modification methylase domain-containing protein [Candidatus Methanoflexus mossambicus]
MNNRLLRLKNKKINNITVSSNIKSAITEWYKKYQAEELKEERRNYLNFENIILKKLLGYKDEDFEFEYPLSGRSVEFMILKDNEPYIAIELKGTKTKDLTKKDSEDKYSAVEQASNYASKESTIEWYIVSNYYEFRLYNHKSQNKYISFTLDDFKPNGYDFDEERIKQFLTVFSREGVLEKNYLKKLYNHKGLFSEDFNLENEFYKIYNETRLLLIKELEENNQINKEKAIEYAQLILNRYIFICFCEDKDLLPDNSSTDEILTPIRRQVLSIQTIWNRLNELFYFINYGNNSPTRQITAYNGGLFKEDLSHLKISDKIEDGDFYKDINIKWSFPEQEHIIDHELRNYPNINPIYRNLLIISSFDFNTDLTENILGHIFENSISDLEELKNETTSKRKKEGVYYTPEHITRYICENTIIPYLSNENNNTVESLINEYNKNNNLNELEKKLHDIKILDPACGSGAFLNKATDTLLNIHKAIFNLKHKNSENLDKEFDNIDNKREILLNNIYGVDLNQESIEITKLALFLKVCKKGMPLPELDKNIKCGNSLIDDSEYTDKPFKWEEEFSEIMNAGGFDVVIGNPPYVFSREKKVEEDMKEYYTKKYIHSTYQINTYLLFTDLSYNILKENGFLGYIIPNNWLTIPTNKDFRKFILESTGNLKIVNSKDKLFDDADVDNSIITFSKSKTDNIFLYELENNEFKLINTLKLADFDDDDYIINFKNSDNKKDLMEKINNNSINLEDYESYKVTTGLKAYQTGKGKPKQTDEMKNERIYHSFTKKDDTYLPYLDGKSVRRYFLKWFGEYLKYGENLAERRPSAPFDGPRVLVRQIPSPPPYCIDATYVENKYLNDINSMIIFNASNKSLKFILGVLNSKLTSFWFISKFDKHQRKIFPQFKVKELKKFPIPIKNDVNLKKELINKVILIEDLIKKHEKEIVSFQKYLTAEFNTPKINKKLAEYYNLSFDELYKEVKKQYKDISRKEKDRLEEEYNGSISITQPLQQEIAKIDNEIDNLVYKLYDLTDEEIEIIEKSSL